MALDAPQFNLESGYENQGFYHRTARPYDLDKILELAFTINPTVIFSSPSFSKYERRIKVG